MGGYQLDTTRAAGVTQLKCLTTANIPLPPACPINFLGFATMLKKQSSCCLAPDRSGDGDISPKRNQSSSPTDCYITDRSVYTTVYACAGFCLFCFSEV